MISQSNISDDGAADITLKAVTHFAYPSTIAVNTVVSGLIAARLLYAHHLLERLRESPDGVSAVKSPYIVAFAIFIESSAVVGVWAVASLVTTILAYRNAQGYVDYPVSYLATIIPFPQICVSNIFVALLSIKLIFLFSIKVLSTLAVVYRVARRQTDDIITALEYALTHIKSSEPSP